MKTDLTFQNNPKPGSQKTILAHWGIYISALTKSLLWAMLWDMTRDSTYCQPIYRGNL